MSGAADPLLEEDLDSDPLVQFGRWFESAKEAGPLAEAAALATAGADGRPSVRMVLVKGWDELGFVFYSNYRSRKGLELATNPQAALLFHWLLLGRQVRLEGTVEPTTAAESDRYFASRPQASQLSAAVSAQSQTVASRDELDRRFDELERAVGDGAVPRPEWWGGYRLVPRSFEFWQHQEGRLHDRIGYVREGAVWRKERLQP